jgi:hypothetical protein
MNPIKVFYKNQLSIKKITFVLFLFLLLWNILIPFLFRLLQQDVIKYWVEVSYRSVNYVLVSITIWLNKDDLQRLNIDRFFIIIFIVAGVILSLYLPFPARVVICLVILFISLLLWLGLLKFGGGPKNKGQTIILIVVLLIPSILTTFRAEPPLNWAIIESMILNAALNADLSQVVIEEVIFRGLLWMFLADLNLRTLYIILIQALLFWLAHSFYLSSNPITFWVYMPFHSILLGIIVWRSKSISASSIGHFLINVVVSLK